MCYLFKRLNFKYHTKWFNFWVSIAIILNYHFIISSQYVSEMFKVIWDEVGKDLRKLGIREEWIQVEQDRSICRRIVRSPKEEEKLTVKGQINVLKSRKVQFERDVKLQSGVFFSIFQVLRRIMFHVYAYFHGWGGISKVLTDRGWDDAFGTGRST